MSSSNIYVHVYTDFCWGEKIWMLYGHNNQQIQCIYIYYITAILFCHNYLKLSKASPRLSFKRLGSEAPNALNRLTALKTMIVG